MESTSVIIFSAICAVILFFVARLILKRNKEAIQLEEKLNRDEFFSQKQATNENDFFEEPEEQRFIPEEEIEAYTDDHEKELAMVNNYLIRNEIKNLGSTEFFDLQESILLYEFVESANDFTVDQIYQIAEKRYVAVIGLTIENSELQDQKRFEEKQIMGIIECRHSLGNGRLKPNKYKEETTAAHGLFSETETRIFNHTLIHEGYVDLQGIYVLCEEFDNRNTGYFAFIDGNTVYLRINRHATLTDLKTMIEILVNYKY